MNADHTSNYVLNLLNRDVLYGLSAGDAEQHLFFVESDRYFCTVDSKGNYWFKFGINDEIRKIPYYPPDLIDEHKKHEIKSGEKNCSAVMQVRDIDNIFDCHAWLSLIIGRAVPQFHVGRMQIPWQDRIINGLRKVGANGQILKDTLARTNPLFCETAAVEGLYAPFNFGILLPVTLSQAMHIYAATDLIAHSDGVKYDMLGKRAPNCMTHFTDNCQVYGVDFMAEILGAGQHSGDELEIADFTSYVLCHRHILPKSKLLSVNIGAIGTMDFYRARGQQGQNIILIDAETPFNNIQKTRIKFYLHDILECAGYMGYRIVGSEILSNDRPLTTTECATVNLNLKKRDMPRKSYSLSEHNRAISHLHFR